MQLISFWHVTNITGENVRLLCTRLTKPKTDGHILTKHPNDNIFGSYPILPGETTEVSTDFWLIPPVRKVGNDFKTTVVLLDQYGNEHKVKNVVFAGPRLKETEKKLPPTESIHLIGNPIEKEIVSVLKAEVNRYKECGRRVGGLGSIQTTIQGQVYKGVGTEWRETDSPKNQTIVENETSVKIDSDNARALINLHARLENDEELEQYFNTLLERLNKQTEYAPIGYFILFVMFLLGRLNDALEKAKRDLYGDKSYGFGDLLRFLDSLLRFRHTSFTSEMLDNIERIIEGLENEHTFRIMERLAAIRAFRLSKI